MSHLVPRSVFAVAALLLAGVSAVQAQSAVSAASQSYVRRDDCLAGGRLSEQECEFAYRNARAEFEEKTPRYRSRATCERAHKRCAVQISAVGSFEDIARAGGGTYVPKFKGIRVSGSGETARVFPEIEGRAGFGSRQVAALDVRVAGRRPVTGDPGRGRGIDVVRSGPGSSGPFVRRGDRDDTIKVPMETREPSRNAAPGLYVDRDGVEWYKPATRR